MLDFVGQLPGRVSPDALNKGSDFAFHPDFNFGVKDSGKYRTLDLLIIVLSFPFLLTLLLCVALIIKLDDPSSPVLFFQTRYGRTGKPFRIVKFRTMHPDAEARKAALLDQSHDKGPGFKLKNDPRITRPGRLLRKTYLDEITQIWNVMKGEMSFVGPRANSFPPEKLEAWQLQRLAVRPGITGSWQVMSDKPTDFAARCLIDIDYVRAKSLRGDCLILFQTVMVALVRRTGA